MKFETYAKRQPKMLNFYKLFHSLAVNWKVRHRGEGEMSNTEKTFHAAK